MLIILTVLALLFWSEILQSPWRWYQTCHRSYWYRCYHRYVEWSFLSVSCKIRWKHWYSIEHHWRWLGTTCDHHLGFCLDTLLLAHYVDRQRYHACYEENRYTWRRYLRYLALVYHWSFDQMVCRQQRCKPRVSLFIATAAVVLVGVLENHQLWLDETNIWWSS